MVATFFLATKKMSANLYFGRWFHWLLACAIGSLVACAEPRSIIDSGDGIGGTGIIASGNSDGIGGTGYSDPGPTDTDGLGGTGAWDNGAVALFGVVTNIQPLVVNGHGMLVNEHTVVTKNANKANQAAVEIGSVAWVKADIKDGVIFAEQIDLQSAVRGPVEYFDSQKQVLEVLGQKVNIGPRANVQQPELVPGDWVEVAGIRNFVGEIEASLVTGSASSEGAFVAGYREIIDSDLSQIGQLQFPAKQAEISEPGVVFVHGIYANKTFKATTVRAVSGLPFEQTVATYVMQAFVDLDGNNVRLSRYSGVRSTLTAAPALSNKLVELDRSGSLIIELTTSSKEGLRVKNIKTLPARHPTQTIIPRYRPPSPHGVLAPGRGIDPLVNSPSHESTVISPGIKGRTPIPATTGAPSGNLPSRPPSTVQPRAPVDSIEINPRPQIKVPAPATQAPSVDALPSATGPR